METAIGKKNFKKLTLFVTLLVKLDNLIILFLLLVFLGRGGEVQLKVFRIIMNTARAKISDEDGGRRGHHMLRRPSIKSHQTPLAPPHKKMNGP